MLYYIDKQNKKKTDLWK